MKLSQLQKEASQKILGVLHKDENKKFEVTKRPLLESDRKQLIGQKKLIERELERINHRLS